MKHLDIHKNHSLRNLLFKYEVLESKTDHSDFTASDFSVLISHYQKHQAIEQLEIVIEKAIKYYPLNGRFRLAEAYFLLEERKPQAAMDALSMAIELENVPYRETQLAKGIILAALHHYEEAIQLLEDLSTSLLHTSKELSEIHYQIARIYNTLDDFPMMFDELRSALKLNPGHEKALERFLFAVESCREYDESIVIHTHILDHDAYNYRAWFNLGHAYYSSSEYEKAIKAFEYAFLINDRFEMAYREYAQLCFEMKQYDKALAIFMELLDHFGSDIDVLDYIGQCLLHTGEYHKARIYFFRALGLYETNDEIYFNIGQTYMRENKYGTAVHFLKQAIQYDNTREDYHYAFAITMNARGKTKKAMQHFRRAVHIAPEQCEYWLDYADMLRKNGRPDQALEILQSAELNSYGAEIFYCQGICLLELGRRKEAITAMDEGFQFDPTRHTVLFRWKPELENNKKIQNMIRYYVTT